jgi:hypothetical protein
MRDAKPVGGSAARFQVPKEFSVREYVGRAPWELSGNEPIQVRVQFRFPESRWVQAHQVGKVIEPLLEDGGAVLEFGVRDLGPFLRWLLTFREQAQVLEPRHVATELAELKERVARLYEQEASK